MADENPADMLAVRALFEAVAGKPLPTEAVAVPGLGTVHVRGLTAAEYDEFEAGCLARGDDGDLTSRSNRPLLVRLCACTPEGKRVFRDDHLDMLRALPAAVINPIAAAAMRLCGLGKAAESDAKN